MVGDKTATALATLGLYSVGDLLRHVPLHWIMGAESSPLDELREGEYAAVVADVEHSGRVGQHPKQRFVATISDGAHQVELTFFAGGKYPKAAESRLAYWEKLLPPGARGIFAGKFSYFRGQAQLTNPDFVTIDASGAVVGGAARNRAMGRVGQSEGMIGLYPQTKKAKTWDIAETVALVLDQVDLADPWPDWVRERAEVLDLMSAFRAVHRPSRSDEVDAGLDRLRFDEAFRAQLTMARRRADADHWTAIPRTVGEDGLLAAFDARLPFSLTEGQRAIGDEVLADLAQERPMQRLLQGEVGSGKTVVAVRAMLAVAESGGQSALLAPTEVLATQHAHSITALLGELAHGGGLLGEQATRVVLLTGSMSAAERRAALAEIASGEAGIVVGTHALLSTDISFDDLALVVVDEQHRFGVEQRAVLSDRARARPHVLVMTATPIPRTVAMTIFGDLTVSTLRQVPAGRSEVSTVVVDEQANPAWVDRAWQRIVEEVGQGRQAFVVCPKVRPTKDDPARSVTELYEALTEGQGAPGPLASLRVAMLHGQLPSAEKDEVMGRFAAGELDVIVATTVVEVGVDVPNASVMVISDADRFGISQLHQLRGRIGRGRHPGVCLLLTSVEADSPARERLDAVARSRDGFELAEVDLAQRREGDVLGANQAGARSSLRLIRVLDHVEVIEQARDIAIEAVRRDPELSDPGFVDAITETELAAQEDWLERN
ncbi:MAG TPA: ATP-dependent DNA helicase RecG [Candidatus Avipropionibacterium avicola]|uniref:ATP-dependent DNA helicase RecG n=1 Tax=Candidatus Avipropionibacterium avicola TaxID=2840701 RepID=A0A9D1KLJ0_9ACTN|nr:ATP-dependent DNA helicase RecG [Candidatus Avipropionibacterium avicola]